MTRTKSTYLTLIAVLLSPMAANADLIDLGDVTRDTNTGLDWLDLTETAGVSVYDILNGYGGLTDDGWQVASQADVCTLFGNGGGIDDDACNAGTTVPDSSGWYLYGSNEPDTTNMINLFGNTALPWYGPNSGAFGFVGYFAEANDNVGGACMFSGYSFCANAGDPGGFVIGDYGTNERTHGLFGVFLTRATSVPEPGTLALFGIGLAAMGLSRRKKKA